MRFLIVNVNWIGDIIFSTLLMRSIKKSFPSSYLATLVPKSGVQILKDNPYLDEIIEFDPFKERGFTGIDILLIKKIKNYNFTHSLHLHRSISRKIYAYIGGIENRIGYNEKLKSFLLTKALSSNRDKIHRALYYFNLGASLGLVDDGNGLDIFVEENDLVKGKDILAVHNIDKFCLIHIGANWEAKRWPLDHYVELLDGITANYELDVVLTGTARDIQDADYIVSHSKSKVTSLVGDTDLRELLSLIKLSQLSITVDSAPLHIATALKKPLISIFGPTDKNITGPFRPEAKTIILSENVNCNIPCYQDVCQHEYKCMRAVTPQSVLDSFDEVLR